MIQQKIRRFQLEVIVEDSAVWAKKWDTHKRTLEGMMKDKGYIPVLDLDYHIAVKTDKDKFVYTLTGHAVYVGDRAWQLMGIANGKEITSTTSRTKSAQS